MIEKQRRLKKKLEEGLHEFNPTNTDLKSLKEIDGISNKTLESIKKEVRQYHDRPSKPEMDIQLKCIKDLAFKVAKVKGNEPENNKNTRSNLSLDLAVLTEARHPALYEEELFIDGLNGITDNALEFCVAGGAQFFPPTGIKHAIEIKYFKTTTSPGRRLKDEQEKWDRLNGDIKELEMLQKDFGANSTHLLIFSNHHIFEGYENRKEGLKDWCSKKNINLWYIHPTVE